MIRPVDVLLRQLAAMNLDIVETRNCLAAVRSETSGAKSSSLLKQLEENLDEMLRHRAKILGQLNSRPRT